MDDFSNDNIDLKIDHAKELFSFLQKNNYNLTEEVIKLYKFSLQQKYLKQLESKIIKLETQLHYDRCEIIQICLQKMRSGIKEPDLEVINKEKEIDDNEKLLLSLKVKIKLERVN